MEHDWQKGGVITADGVPDAHADHDGPERLRAVQTGSWRRTWTVTGDGDPIVLTPKSPFSRGLVLHRGGTQIGETGTSHLLTARPRMTTRAPLAPDLAAFVLWVAYVDLTRRSSDAGGAAT